MWDTSPKGYLSHAGAFARRWSNPRRLTEWWTATGLISIMVYRHYGSPWRCSRPFDFYVPYSSVLGKCGTCRTPDLCGVLRTGPPSCRPPVSPPTMSGVPRCLGTLDGVSSTGSTRGFKTGRGSLRVNLVGKSHGVPSQVTGSDESPNHPTELLSTVEGRVEDR